ncbi:MAG: hypothetical protein WCD79_21990 [Chthoniobacteraceae bacterium]
MEVESVVIGDYVAVKDSTWMAARLGAGAIASFLAIQEGFIFSDCFLDFAGIAKTGGLSPHTVESTVAQSIEEFVEGHCFILDGFPYLFSQLP